jgi:hypothetical protein
MSKRRVIHKFPLKLSERQVVKVPGFEQVLVVRMVNGIPCLYCVVNPADVHNVKEITATIVGTGQEWPEDLSVRAYRASLLNGRYVWHVFLSGGDL